MEKSDNGLERAVERIGRNNMAILDYLGAQVDAFREIRLLLKEHDRAEPEPCPRTPTGTSDDAGVQTLPLPSI